MSVKHSTLTGSALHVPFNSGLDADKSASPTVNQWYYATDTKKLYYCHTAGSWVWFIPIPASSLAQGDIFYYDGSAIVRLGAGTSGYYLKTQGAGANPIWAQASAGTSGTFVDGDLVAGKLTVTHSLGLSAPYGRIVKIFDNAGKEVDCPITFATNSFEIDLSDFGTLSGTWGYRYI